MVAEEVEPAVKGSVGPGSVFVVGVVPAVVAPESFADDEVNGSVAIVVGGLPLAGAEFSILRRELVFVEGLAFVGTIADEIQPVDARSEDDGSSFGVGDADVGIAFANFNGLLEDGHLGSSAGILEEVDPVVGFVRAGDDEIEVAVVIPIHGEGPGPETDPEVHGESGVVVFEGLQIGFRGGETREAKEWNEDRDLRRGHWMQSFCWLRVSVNHPANLVRW